MTQAGGCSALLRCSNAVHLLSRDVPAPVLCGSCAAIAFSTSVTVASLLRLMWYCLALPICAAALPGAGSDYISRFRYWLGKLNYSEGPGAAQLQPIASCR